jgi:hypothetical protein
MVSQSHTGTPLDVVTLLTSATTTQRVEVYNRCPVV